MNIKILTDMFKTNDCILDVRDDSIIIFGEEYSCSIKLSEVDSISVTRQMAREQDLK